MTISPSRLIAALSSSRFYVRLLSRIMNNFGRKRWLQPLAYVYADYPFTKRKKTYATLSPMEQFRASQFRFCPEHPETSPHLHSVMLIPPELVDRFKAIASELENFFQNLGPANRTLHATPLHSIDELRDVIFYSSKLLKRPPISLRDVDLYIVLPKAKSEPVYVKSDWEGELETGQRNRVPRSANEV
jgi:hypothetical protein